MSESYLKFKTYFPGVLFIDAHHLDALPAYLQDKGWIEAGEEIVKTEKPGDGNMNFVLRIITTARSLIIKQSRPWVEKYPKIEAPVERIGVEARFYELLSKTAGIQKAIPALIGYDKAHFILAIEDLGQTADYTFVYQKTATLDDQEMSALIAFISRLHNTDFDVAQATFPSNQVLKKLNHEHIFVFPYLPDNGFDLDIVQEGLQEMALPFRKDEALKAKIAQLGEVYLGTGSVLLHGDYYPGSWLKTTAGPKVIDPEFAFFGRPEFDLGVMAAHLKMAAYTDKKIREALRTYQKPSEFDAHLYVSFCGAEILRRVIGLAQLPLQLTLEEKRALLTWAQAAVLYPQDTDFML